MALTVPATASAASAAGASTRPVVTTADPEDAALLRLRADADGAVRVHRDPDGRVDFVGSVDGEGVLAGSARPATSFARQVEKYGEAFGIDGQDSTAVVEDTIDSATGTVVRSQQRVDGVPVFGGQVVMSLDDDEDVVSITADTTAATSVARTVVPVATARRTALRVTAKAHDVPVRSLTARDRGRVLYDPAIVHQTDPAGPRPVWEFEVADGAGIRERVLVGTGRGEVVLHFDDAPSVLDRRICDNANTRIFYSDAPVPTCTVAPDRVEGGAASSVADVNDVYDNIGATHDVYDEIAGIDLTDLIGTEVDGQKSLMSIVRWCVVDDSCPYSNAFWDGSQVVFGEGWGAADDVVAHELTHGYVEKTAALFSLNQSGALNESFGDTIGEIVDHRNAASTESDADWALGEDLPGVGIAGSMKDPTLSGQPDRMTSPKYVTSDLTFGIDGIHENGGVGNKTAYLISQGSDDFNGRTLTGIDAGDASLSKTALLYLEVIPKLTSGAQYADLGRALRSTCAELAAAGTAGFTDADCESVGIAVEATELSSRPTDPRASHREAPYSCTVGHRRVDVWRDDDGASVFGFTRGALWHRTPEGNTPTYARSGDSSWFGLDPDPSLDGRSTSNLTSRSFVVPRSQSSYLHFDHAYVFEYYENETGSRGEYLDGGQVLVQTLTRGRWTTRYVPSINGPSRTSADIPGRIFGGDSRGYGSSRFNLSSLAGQTVRVVFRVVGDMDIAYIGWWVDDVRFYTCPDSVASPPRMTVSAGMRGVAVSWTPPAYLGGPVASYRVTRSRGPARTLPATARRTTFTPVNPNVPLTISVAAVAADTSVGAPATVRVYPTVTRVSSSLARVGRNRPFSVTGKVVRRGTAAAVRMMPVVLQRRAVDQSSWRTVAYGRTGPGGTRTWSVAQSGPMVYRVLARGVSTTFGSTSTGQVVRIR